MCDARVGGEKGQEGAEMFIVVGVSGPQAGRLRASGGTGVHQNERLQ